MNDSNWFHDLFIQEAKAAKEYRSNSGSNGGSSEIERQFIAAIERRDSELVTKLPAGLTIIGDYAFNSCTSLALDSLPAGVTRIGDNAFNKCTSLALAFLPAGVTHIGDNAFSYCTNLVLTSIPDGVTHIGDNAFSYCTNLVLTSLPDGVTRIGDGAFSFCTKVALTSLPKSVKNIGYGAFNNCIGLTEITFEGIPSVMESSVFDGCINLRAINVPWSEGEVANAPWGATNATINYLGNSSDDSGELVTYLEPAEYTFSAMFDAELPIDGEFDTNYTWYIKCDNLLYEFIENSGSYMSTANMEFELDGSVLYTTGDIANSTTGRTHTIGLYYKV